MVETRAQTQRYASATLREDRVIFDRTGNRLGKITEVMVDLMSGRVEFVVASFGGFLGLGQKYHPLPYQILQMHPDGTGFIIDAETSLIDGSPAYRLDDAPVFDEGYGDRLRSYYGLHRDAETGRHVHRPQT